MRIDSTIESFRQHVASKNGFFLPQRFLCRIWQPNSIPRNEFLSIGASSARDLQFMCSTASIPGRTISTGEVAAPGPEQKYPYQDTYEDLECTFLCTNNSNSETNADAFGDGGVYKGLPEKRFFDAWMGGVINQHNMLVNYSDQYAMNITLVIFDGGNNQIGSYEFHRCYPLSVGAVELSHQSEEPATFPVTFNVDRWKYMDSN